MSQRERLFRVQAACFEKITQQYYQHNHYTITNSFCPKTFHQKRIFLFSTKIGNNHCIAVSLSFCWWITRWLWSNCWEMKPASQNLQTNGRAWAWDRRCWNRINMQIRQGTVPIIGSHYHYILYRVNYMREVCKNDSTYDITWQSRHIHVLFLTITALLIKACPTVTWHDLSPCSKSLGSTPISNNALQFI
jgi:hypothetical protein